MKKERIFASISGEEFVFWYLSFFSKYTLLPGVWQLMILFFTTSLSSAGLTNRVTFIRVEELFNRANVAQSVERVTRNDQAAGSIPVVGSIGWRITLLRLRLFAAKLHSFIRHPHFPNGHSLPLGTPFCFVKILLSLIFLINKEEKGWSG